MAETTKKYTALSLGWGVQSFTLAAMVALGDLPPVDVAIHADTTHESILTYRFAERWTPWLEEHGVMVKTVTALNTGIISNYGFPEIPAFTGNGGKLNRQCTVDWKIYEIKRYIRSVRNRLPVEQWIGISTDEALRMKPSRVKYIVNRWPLIELGISRKDCIRHLEAHGLEVPPKSACVFCPYHSTEDWRRIRNMPEDWRNAVTADRVIRKASKRHIDLFVHPSRKPLELVDLRTEQQKGQMDLWDEECTGLCGV